METKTETQDQSKTQIEVKSYEHYREHKNTYFANNPIEFKETDPDCFLPFFLLDKAEFNYDIFYQTNIKGESIPLRFPSNMIVRDFENFSENYMYLQIAHHKEIFLQLNDYFTHYPNAFKYRFSYEILKKMSDLLNKYQDSKYYDDYHKLYITLDKFKDDFNPAFPCPVLPKLDFPSIELIAFLPVENKYGKLEKGKFHLIFNSTQLGSIIKKAIQLYSINISNSEIARLFAEYFMLSQGKTINRESLETNIASEFNVMSIKKLRIDINEAIDFLAKFINKAMSIGYFKQK